MERIGSETNAPPFEFASSYAGTIVYPPGGQFGPRWQRDVQLVLLHTGSMKLQVDDSVHTVRPGHIVLLKPGHREQFRFAEGEETWHRWITSMAPAWSDEMLAWLDTLPFELPLSEPMNRLTDMMLSVKLTRSDDDLLLRSLGSSALLLYAHEAGLQPNSERSMHPAVLIAKHAIQERYGEELTLADIAGAAQVTPEHLVRLFGRHVGATPMRYLWEFRAARGADLLRGTGLSVSEIAARCGFASSYHFARTVKRCFGRTPSELRKESWSG